MLFGGRRIHPNRGGAKNGIWERFSVVGIDGIGNILSYLEGATKVVNGVVVHLHDDQTGRVNPFFMKAGRNVVTHLKSQLTTYKHKFGDHEIDNMLMYTFESRSMSLQAHMSKLNVINHMITLVRVF